MVLSYWCGDPNIYCEYSVSTKFLQHTILHTLTSNPCLSDASSLVIVVPVHSLTNIDFS